MTNCSFGQLTTALRQVNEAGVGCQRLTLAIHCKQCRGQKRRLTVTAVWLSRGKRTQQLTGKIVLDGPSDRGKMVVEKLQETDNCPRKTP